MLGTLTSCQIGCDMEEGTNDAITVCQSYLEGVPCLAILVAEEGLEREVLLKAPKVKELIRKLTILMEEMEVGYA